jgi:hypothetical protein
LDLLFSSQISFQEMAIAFLSTSGEDCIRSILESFEEMDSIQLTGAHQFNDTHVGRILNPHGARQVGRGVSTVMAGKGHDFGLISFNHQLLLKYSIKSIQQSLQVRGD